MIRNASVMMHVLGSDNLLHVISYPSSFTNQSLSISTVIRDTTTTSNGITYRQMAVPGYSFSLSPSTGYTAGNILINGVNQGSSSIYNFTVDEDIYITATEASYSGVIYTLTYSFSNSVEMSYSLTTTNAVTGVTETTTGINTSSSFNISLPVNSTYSVEFTINDDAYIFMPSGKTYTSSGTISQTYAVPVGIGTAPPTPAS